MATTDQPQFPGQQPAAAHLPPAADGAPAGPPAPRSHVGVIIASIIGGILLLAIAFGAGGLAGGVIGWTIGTQHHGDRFVIDERHSPGQDERGWQQDGRGEVRPEPGQPRERHDRFEQDGRGDDLPVPVPSPTS